MAETEKSGEVLHLGKGEDTDTRRTKYLDLSFARDTKSTAGSALFLAIVAILLSLGLFFLERHRLPELSAKVARMDAAYTQQMNALDKRIDAMGDLPKQLRIEAMRESLHVMAMRANLLASQVTDKADKEKLTKILNLLGEINNNVGK